MYTKKDSQKNNFCHNVIDTYVVTERNLSRCMSPCCSPNPTPINETFVYWVRNIKASPSTITRMTFSDNVLAQIKKHQSYPDNAITIDIKGLPRINLSGNGMLPMII